MVAAHTAGSPRAGAVAAAVLVVVGVLGGCSGGGTTEGSSAPSGSASSPTAEPPGTAAGSAAAGSAAPGTGLDARMQAVRELLGPNVDAGVMPGVVVAVRDGDEVRVYAHGLADRRRRTAMSLRTAFPIASITKSMTATVVMDLVADGRLALDDTVGELLPGLLPHGGSITVEQLLSHGSGLPEVDDVPLLERHTTDPRDAVEQIADLPLQFPPGSDHTYRNVNYLILGLVVEEVTGEPLARALRNVVVRPAGMRDSTLATPGVPITGVPTGYVGQRPWPPPDLGYALAAGGVSATAADVSRFYDALLDARLVPGRAVRDMMRLRADPFPIWGGYGLGLAATTTSCGTAYGHAGRLPGYAGEAWTDPATGRSIVLLTNTGDHAILGSVDGALEAALCG